MVFPQIGTEVGYGVTPALPDTAHTELGKGLGAPSPDQDNPMKGTRAQAYERNGASYAPKVTYVFPNEQVAGQTQRNVRILPSIMGQSKPFWAGRMSQGNDVNGA